MALLVGAQILPSLKHSTSVSRVNGGVQWNRAYASAAKGKGKGKSGSKPAVVKVKRVSRTELRKRSVILTQTVPGVGEIGEEMKVARGFARNFLFPKQYAKLATDELRAQYAHHYAAIDFDAREKAAALEQHKKKISKVTVLLKRHLVEETKKPIAPISRENIVEKLKKQHKIDLKPEQIELAEPLDRYGKFELPVKIEGISTLLHINITQR